MSGAASSAGKRLGERPRPTVVGVVEEVLLRLVENEVDVAFGLRALERRERRSRSARRPPLPRPPRRAPTIGSSLQLEKTTTSGLLGQLAERARDRGAEQRRLPDAARPVEHGQPRGDEVRDDDLGLALAPEEQERVELGVLEGVEPLVRRLRLRRVTPPRAAARAARRTTADRRRARRRRIASRTPARAGSARAAPPTSGTRPAARPRSG